MEGESNIIINALCDYALRFVRAVTGNPHRMITKLHKRCVSKSTATLIIETTESVTIKYCEVREDMSKHVNRLAALVKKLKTMGLYLATIWS